MDDKILVIEDEEARDQIGDLDDRIFMLEEEMRVIKTITSTKLRMTTESRILN